MAVGLDGKPADDDVVDLVSSEHTEDRRGILFPATLDSAF